MATTQVDVSDIHLRDIQFKVTRADGRVVDFSDLVTGFRWADHVNLAGVEVDLTLAGPVSLMLQIGGEGSSCRITAPLVDLKTGQIKRQEIWQGIFEDVVDLRREGMTERVITAYDILHNFAVSEEDFVFKGLSLSSILKKICRDFDVPKGRIVDSNRNLGQIISRGDTLWDTVQKAVQKHFDATGEVFRVFAEFGKVKMVRQGNQDFVWRFEDEWSLTRVRRSRSLAPVINQVKVYGSFVSDSDKPSVKSTRKNTSSQDKYGLRQRIDYASEDDEQDVIDIAKATIKRFAAPEETLEITGWLVPNLRAGEQIRYKDTEMKIDRLYYVESMEANWSAEMADSVALCKRSEVDPGIILDEVSVA